MGTLRALPTRPAEQEVVMEDASLALAAPFIPLRLQIIPGGASISLAKPDMLVGRHSEADIRLHLPDVSRRHCRFRFFDGNWHVYDLQSTNGVFVNEERVGQAEVHDADIIRIGAYSFEAHIEASVPITGHANTMHTLESPTLGPQRQAS
jgi:pSer/pThr/pTyr-binding forkhead associated (FHA) protein